MNYPATDTLLLTQLSQQTLCDILTRVNLTHVTARDGRKTIPFYDRKGSREVRDGSGGTPSPTHGAGCPGGKSRGNSVDEGDEEGGGAEHDDGGVANLG